MANSEGGTLYLGIEDDGRVSGVCKQHSDAVKMKAAIQEHTYPPVPVSVTLEESDEGQKVLVINIDSPDQLYATSDGRYGERRLHQDGEPYTKPLTPPEIVQRLSYLQLLDPSAQVITSITAAEAFSSLEHERLRKLVGIHNGDRTLLSLTDDELDLALGFSRSIKGIVYPTVAGVLFVGKREVIKDFVPGHEVLFQVLDDTKVIMNPPAMFSSLIEIFETVNNLFLSRVSEQELQVGLFRIPVPDYEHEAFREGFVNALVHRDYYRVGAVVVQMRHGVLTITSPGGFVRGVSPDNILTVGPTPRNRLLAEAAKRIGLAERTGRGVDKIFASMIKSGHSFPDYSSSTDTFVELRMKSYDKDLNFVRMIVEEQSRLDTEFSVDMLIMLSVLRAEHRVTLDILAKRVQKQSSEARDTIEWLVEHELADGIGNGPGRYYIPSKKIFIAEGNPEGYSRQSGSDTRTERKKIMVLHGKIGDEGLD